MSDVDEQLWLREQLYEINVMLRTLLTLEKLDGDIRLAAPPRAPARPRQPPPSHHDRGR